MRLPPRERAAGGLVVRRQPDDVGAGGRRLSVRVAPVPEENPGAGFRIDFVEQDPDFAAEPVPGVERQPLGAGWNVDRDFAHRAGRNYPTLRQQAAPAHDPHRSGPHVGLGGRLGRIFVDGVARRIAERHRGAEEAEAVEEQSDLVGVAPVVAAVDGGAGESFGETAWPPASDPAAIRIDESDPFEIGIALGVVDLQPRSGLAAIGGFQDRAGIEILQGDEAEVLAEKLDFPAPLAEREIRLLAGQPIRPSSHRRRRSPAPRA